jgi:transposase InsO family protein
MNTQTNKEGEACASTLRCVFQQLDLDRLGFVLQSDNDPSFNSEVLQDMVREFGLKHVFSKTYSSASQGKVERTQLTLWSMVG